ncbi:Biotin-requiring enzyme [Sporobacter termitidis DSM 10068]|uniref:Biotin-requiring enzyme n=1 Tax=Sporobacter termitidis DSM 10068 TaxID=1123282 RepID=A0A1M5ZG30_9FIRM|nr:biotin/lipoyl-containing protein [Sporobacter termitidis]SHI23124.1 Biotin-requiring enzyme [Sporobacter termitidis DSM 10068]
MKNYKITINGKTYDVGVEEADGGVEVKSVQAAVSAPKAAPAAPAPATAPAPKAAAAPKAAGSGDVTAPLPGTVLSVAVSEGQQVKAGQVLVIFEAMKMENEIVAPAAGTVKKVHVSKGAVLETGTPVVSIG